jgi:uncharacterized membrane protein
MFANARFLAAAAVLGATLVIARAIATVSESERQLATMLRWFALAGLWLLATIEVTRFDSEPVALSVTWAAFAVAFVVAGFARHVRALRLCGLGLLGLTVGKLVLVDLAALDQLARVVSFAAAGAVMIGVSFAYHRVDRSLRARE